MEVTLMYSSTILDILWSHWFPYGLGLIAAGLIPVKTRWAHLGSFLSLGLLWGWLALDSWGSHPLWVVSAAIEALLFLTLGAALGWFELRLRHGFWAVVGTSFIVYSLL